MGFLDFLFANNQAQSPSSQLATVKRTTAKSEEHPKEKSEDAIFKEAFNKATRTITAPKDVLKNLFCDFKEALFSGSPRNCEKATVKHLAGSGWTWGDFDLWHAEFTARGEWPCMWSAFADDEENEAPPETVKEALFLFSVNELKDMIKENGIIIKPALKTRAETEAAVILHLSWEDIQKRVTNRLIQKKNMTEGKLENAKCHLLAHTIDMTFYALRHYYKKTTFIEHNPFGNTYVMCVNSINGCEIEKEFANRFNHGETTEIPPYFPGDRSGLSLKKR